MDASSASDNLEANSDINIRSFFYQVQRRGVDYRNNRSSTIIKFTKLPEFDFDSKVVWPQKNTYVLQPRLRRIITLNDEDPIISTSRTNPQKQMSSPYSGRKIVTIKETEDNRPPLISNKKLPMPRVSKPISAKSQEEEKFTPKISSRPSLPYKNPNKSDTTRSISFNTNNESKTITKTKIANRMSRSNIPNRDAKVQAQDNKSRIFKEKEKSQNLKNTHYLPKKTTSSVSKNMHANINIHEFDMPERNSPKMTSIGNTLRHTLPVITVPLDRSPKPALDTGTPVVVDSSTEVERNILYKDMSTECNQTTADVVTEPENKPKVLSKHNSVQTDKFFVSNYDSLIIPNVTLLKDKSEESREEIIKMCKSLPNLQVPALEIMSHKEDNTSSSGITSKSFIIGRATLTYTTKQKIDFHVVSNKEEAVSSTSSSPLPYPMNVVSVFKKELLRNKNAAQQLVKDDTKRKKDEINSEQVRHGNELQSFNNSHVANSSKLVKPSELISTISLNNGLLQNDYITEQFQRELNFIDSFFESLQYLESFSASNKSFTDKSVEHWVSKSGFNVKGPEYDSLFSTFQNGMNINDSETMASKSLCLLNLLIRDEQKRAKNLLFVLKMREDALKDFTKSQILWLENKKKHDNIDIPTLKKKQRGALLKLQHECGEMQRMRKALLALSEKRKVALMKTKKNIELKLKNNVTVEHMLLGKKKLKRNPICDRSLVPLKCFDLSSSGCEDSTTSRAKSETALHTPHLLTPVSVSVKSAEKSIQTGESLLHPSQVDESTEMAAVNFVTVDGGYLNILFHNLSLPEIFSTGKNYEVNEEALRSIVNSANNRSNLNESDLVEKFIDQIKNCDPERSTTPSTARSLVEEFDQYYKGLFEDDQSLTDLPEQEVRESLGADIEVAVESKEKNDDTVSSTSNVSLVYSDTTAQVSTDATTTAVTSEVSVISVVECLDSKLAVVAPAGPLPVPAGASVVAEFPTGLITPTPVLTKSSGTIMESGTGACALPYLPAPAQSEAQELRRQQLAIEREIKALEQQQSQLLAVREIPDKPPPPYIPPAEARAPRPARLFAADDTVARKVEDILAGSTAHSPEPTDSFDLFIEDFCQESVNKHEKDQEGKPWDACNLLPQKPSLTKDELVKKTSGALKEVLAGVSPALVCNMGSRRSDHIDDILFAEWRAYEPQWTAHHAAEALVKNQLFEGILQHILDKTLTEYKKVVLEEKQSHMSNSD